MPVLRVKANGFVLAIVIGLSFCVRFASAAPLSAQGLKKGELTELAGAASALVYNARVAFVLYSGPSPERDQILTSLLKDNTTDGLQAVAEIASVTHDSQIRSRCLEHLLRSRPKSNSGLEFVARYGSTKALRKKASTALNKKTLDIPRALESGEVQTEVQADSQANVFLNATAGEMRILTSLVGGQKIKDFEQLFTLAPSLSNGSRYRVQSYFLTRILALQEAPESERLVRFDALLNEIEVFLHKPKKRLKIDTETSFQAFKASLVGRYATLKDEIQFSSGLRDLSPLNLAIAPAIENEAREFSISSRKADIELPKPYQGSFFDFLSDDSSTGFLFRLQLKSLPETQKTRLLNKISSEFKERHESLKSVAQEMIQSGAIRFEDRAEQRFLELMIENYFSTFSFEETANIMKAGIERPDLSSGNDLFRLFVMHAGPQMQKLFQVVARRPELSADLAKTFQALEDAGLKSPWEKMAPEFKEPPVGFEWVSLSKKAFVGSMAETYAGVVRNKETGETIKIAARTLKSDIKDRVEREIPRLIHLGEVLDQDPILRANHFPKVGPVMSDVMSMAKAELDVQETIRSQKTGERVYTATRKFSRGRKLNFETAKTLTARNQNVIYSTWLEGEKFEDYRHRDPKDAVEVAEATAKHWLENALFKERFFHADLHQGNLKVRREGNGDITVGLLDFGMVGHIEKSERSVLIRLGLATKQNTNPTLIAKYLYAMSVVAENEISEQKLIAEARAHMKSTSISELTMDHWMAWGMSLGLKLPKKITAFGRGIGTVEQLLVGTGSQNGIVDMMRKVALAHAIELAPDLVRYVRDFTVATVQEHKAKRAERKLEVSTRSASGFGFRCESVFAH